MYNRPARQHISKIKSLVKKKPQQVNPTKRKIKLACLLVVIFFLIDMRHSEREIINNITRLISVNDFVVNAKDNFPDFCSKQKLSKILYEPPFFFFDEL